MPVDMSLRSNEVSDIVTDSSHGVQIYSEPAAHFDSAPGVIGSVISPKKAFTSVPLDDYVTKENACFQYDSIDFEVSSPQPLSLDFSCYSSAAFDAPAPLPKIIGAGGPPPPPPLGFTGNALPSLLGSVGSAAHHSFSSVAFGAPAPLPISAGAGGPPPPVGLTGDALPCFFSHAGSTAPHPFSSVGFGAAPPPPPVGFKADALPYLFGSVSAAPRPFSSFDFGAPAPLPTSAGVGGPAPCSSVGFRTPVSSPPRDVDFGAPPPPPPVGFTADALPPLHFSAGFAASSPSGVALRAPAPPRPPACGRVGARLVPSRSTLGEPARPGSVDLCSADSVPLVAVDPLSGLFSNRQSTEAEGKFYHITG